MDTYEHHAHFAWDLLDPIKQPVEPPSVPKPAIPERGTPEFLRLSQAPSPILSDATPVADASSIAVTNPPEATVPPLPEPTDEEYRAPLPQDSTLDEAPSRERVPLSEPPPETRRPPLLIGNDGDIARLSWVDVDRSTAPGEYESRYGVVQLRPEDILIWQRHPHATFAVLPPSPLSERGVFWLGTFDLGHQGEFADDKE